MRRLPGSAIPSAKWDGDTLVVDTVDFNGRTRLDTIGHPHSDATARHRALHAHRREHIALRSDHRRSQDFTKPWTNKRIFTLRPDWEIMEYSCEENNKDFYEGHIKAPPRRSRGVQRGGTPSS